MVDNQTVSMRPYARQTAERAGIDPSKFERQITAESNWDPSAYNSQSGASGIAQIIPRFHPGVDVWNPIASLNYAADLMRNHRDFWVGKGYTGQVADGLALSAYNAGRQATIDGLANRKPGWPFAETVRYLEIILPSTTAEAKAILTGAATVPPPTVIPFSPDAVCDVQPDQWSCSVQAAQWLLRSIGRNPGDQWMHDQLVPVIVSTAVGLQDASGRGLAEWITAQYGQEMSFAAQASPVTFDDVWAGAGVNPMMCGGRAYNHWVGVRRRNDDGTLSLANPAPGFKGVSDRISRSQWDALGAFSCVWIDRGAAAQPAPQPVPQPSRSKVLLAEIRARLEELDRITA